MKQDRHYPERPDKVYFFGTCLVDLLYPEAGIAAMELLRREGVGVIFPHGQTCCGQPAWNAGYREQARQVARAQLRCFARDYPIVVPSGSCAGMMHLHYPELFRDTPEQAQAEALAARVYELTEFLVHVLKIRLTDLGPPTRVALHTSCSARRGMGVAAEHEGLIGQLGNVELVEPQRKEECCGFGGTFALKHPDISTEMVSEKARLIAETGVRELVSGDCGCLMNIAGRLGHQGSGIRGRHIASFLWERTHASDE